MKMETIKRHINNYHDLSRLIGEARAYKIMKNSITNDDAYTWQEKEGVLAELLSLHIAYAKRKNITHD